MQLFFLEISSLSSDSIFAMCACRSVRRFSVAAIANSRAASCLLTMVIWRRSVASSLLSRRCSSSIERTFASIFINWSATAAFSLSITCLSWFNISTADATLSSRLCIDFSLAMAFFLKASIKSSFSAIWAANPIISSFLYLIVLFAFVMIDFNLSTSRARICTSDRKTSILPVCLNLDADSCLFASFS